MCRLACPHVPVGMKPPAMKVTPGTVDDEKESGGGGQGGFDKWLMDLLVCIQWSIERHVASVFKRRRRRRF